MHLNVIGVGSRLSGDDEVGLRLVEEWQSRHDEGSVRTHLWDSVDAATLTQSLLDLEGAALIVDCADLGIEPGECMILEEGDWRFHWRDALTTHGLGVAEALTLARSLGFRFPTWIMGIQPFDLSLGAQLSRNMDRRLPDLLESLSRWIRGLEKQREEEV